MPGLIAFIRIKIVIGIYEPVEMRVGGRSPRLKSIPPGRNIYPCHVLGKIVPLQPGTNTLIVRLIPDRRQKPCFAGITFREGVLYSGKIPINILSIQFSVPIVVVVFVIVTLPCRTIKPVPRYKRPEIHIPALILQSNSFEQNRL